MNYSIIFRTIIAAARGGRLRQLFLSPEVAMMHELFAVRSLLPLWIAIEDWGPWSEHMHKLSRPPMPAVQAKQYYQAARTLRVVLAHASLWLPSASTGARYSRRLTRDEVQSLRGYFVKLASGSLPLAFTLVTVDELKGEVRSPLAVFDLYLPWLQRDAQLAQKVADAWTAVVDRKEADVVKCECEQCEAR